MSKHKVYMYNPGNFGGEEIRGEWPNYPSQYVEWSEQSQDIALWVDTDGRLGILDGNPFYPNLVSKWNEVKAQKNIMLLLEPRHLCPHNYDFVLKYHELFDAVFSSYPDYGDGSDKFKYFKGFGRTYIPHNEWNVYNKSKNVAAVFSDRKKVMPGYDIRWGIRQSFIKDQIDFNNPITDRKVDGTKDYRFEIVVKNEDYPTWQEKLVDALLVGAIPIYWTKDKSYLEDVFDLDGFIFFETVEELESIFESGILTEEYYNERIDSIKHNFEVAKNYTCLGDTLWNQGLKEVILNENNL